MEANKMDAFQRRISERIKELREHLEFLRRNGFYGQDEIEEKITLLNQERMEDKQL